MMRFLTAAFLVLVAASPARADDSGGISGYVRDGSGKPLPHVSVQYIRTDAGTPVVRRIETDESGFFNDITLEPGRYTILVEGALGKGSSSCAVRDVFGDEVAFVTIVADHMTRDCASSAGSPLVDSSATADVYRI